MSKTFVESRVFSARREEFLDDEAYRAVQNELMMNPDKGHVMPGCGGLRKIRVPDPRRGKGGRGGARVIYLHHPEADRIDLIAIYGKHEQDDLTTDQKKHLGRLARQARDEARASLRRKGRSAK